MINQTNKNTYLHFCNRAGSLSSVQIEVNVTIAAICIRFVLRKIVYRIRLWGVCDLVSVRSKQILRRIATGFPVIRNLEALAVDCACGPSLDSVRLMSVYCKAQDEEAATRELSSQRGLKMPGMSETRNENEIAIYFHQNETKTIPISELRTVSNTKRKTFPNGITRC